MAALTTNTTFKGDGLKYNVRSDKIERVIDFSQFGFAPGVNYEIGDLPGGFVPRAIGILELKKQVIGDGGDAAASTVSVKIKSDSSTLASRTLGTAVGNTFALAVSGAVSSSVATISPVGVGATLCVVADNAIATGLVKIVISGDMMEGVFDANEARDDYDPAEHVHTNTVS